jgi:hypothetical protein
MSKLGQGIVVQPTTIEPIAVRLRVAEQISGFSRSDLYRKAARDELVLLKNGGTTLVDMASLKKAIAALPALKPRARRA